ncbi:MAG: ATPase [Prevotella sp.]|nr:ATPase [Prevotella sp.]
MKLIADSGSTKTDWSVTSGNSVALSVKTQGINPFHQPEKVIGDILSSELLPQIEPVVASISEIHFYGSGCNEANAAVMQALLSRVFSDDVSSSGYGVRVFVYSDLLAAARAVCGTSPGIACIMGTGVNSCLYDGTGIVSNTRPLGYILGDEGSGAVLGKLFLNALYKGFLPQDMVGEFEQWIGMSYQDIITRVYREPMANRFLAGIAPFIHDRIDIPAVRDIVVDNFRNFFRRNVVQYKAASLPVGAVGSIAYFFRDELCEAASLEGFTLSRVLRSPMDGLVAYHIGNPILTPCL